MTWRAQAQELCLGPKKKPDRSKNGLAKEMRLEAYSSAPKPHGQFILRSRHDRNGNELTWACDGRAATLETAASSRRHRMSLWDLQEAQDASSLARGD